MSADASGPTPPRPAFCPKCKGTMGLKDPRCPHCGYDFPAPPERSFLPLWAVLAMLAFVIAINQLGLGLWLDIALWVLFLLTLIGAAWRLWVRFRDTR
jgi:hypothetical protein